MPTDRETSEGATPLDRFDRGRTTLAAPELEEITVQVRAHTAELGAAGVEVAGNDAASPAAAGPARDAYALVEASAPSQDAKAVSDGRERGGLATGEGTRETAPAPSEAATQRGTGRVRRVLPGLLSRRDPRSYVLSPATLLTQRAEDFRQVRAQIKRSLGDHGTVIVVSASHGEGRTITALNLGIAFAQEYERVVYVESDLRRPTLHAFFDFEHGRGLASLLQRQSRLTGTGLEEALFKTDVPGFYLLPAGVRSGPPEILDSPRMAELMHQLAVQADWAILDAPPLLRYAEAQSLVGLADGVLVVALEGRTRQPELQELSLRLTAAGAPVVGVTYLRRD